MVWRLDVCCEVALVPNAPSHTLRRAQVIKNALGCQTLTMCCTRCESSAVISNVRDVLQMLGYWFSPSLPRDVLNSLIFINNKETLDMQQSKSGYLTDESENIKLRGKKPPPTLYLNICNVLYFYGSQEREWFAFIAVLRSSLGLDK